MAATPPAMIKPTTGLLRRRHRQIQRQKRPIHHQAQKASHGQTHFGRFQYRCWEQSNTHTQIRHRIRRGVPSAECAVELEWAWKCLWRWEYQWDRKWKDGLARLGLFSIRLFADHVHILPKDVLENGIIRGAQSSFVGNLNVDLECELEDEFVSIHFAAFFLEWPALCHSLECGSGLTGAEVVSS